MGVVSAFDSLKVVSYTLCHIIIVKWVLRKNMCVCVCAGDLSDMFVCAAWLCVGVCKVKTLITRTLCSSHFFVGSGMCMHFVPVQGSPYLWYAVACSKGSRLPGQNGQTMRSSAHVWRVAFRFQKASHFVNGRAAPWIGNLSKFLMFSISTPIDSNCIWFCVKL